MATDPVCTQPNIPFRFDHPTPRRDSQPLFIGDFVRTLFVLLALLSACNLTAPPPDQLPGEDFETTAYGDEKPDNAEPAEAWSSQDDPTLFTQDLDFDVDALWPATTSPQAALVYQPLVVVLVVVNLGPHH